MVRKCVLCKEEIGVTFLDKLGGTIVKVGEGESSRKFYACSVCQKECGEKLRERISGL